MTNAIRHIRSFCPQIFKKGIVTKNHKTFSTEKKKELN